MIRCPSYWLFIHHIPQTMKFLILSLLAASAAAFTNVGSDVASKTALMSSKAELEEIAAKANPVLKVSLFFFFRAQEPTSKKERNQKSRKEKLISVSWLSMATLLFL